MPPPISIIIVTKNVGHALEPCLKALSGFDDIHIIDSGNDSAVKKLAETYHAVFTPYEWDGAYPKKRGWSLQTLPLKHGWVFFVDADEIVTPELRSEINRIFETPPTAAGYFIKGRYVWNGQILRYGLKNNKIALFNRHKMHFPIIDDLDCPGMGEIEGHYQPVVKANGDIKTINTPLLHHANHSKQDWTARHQRYAAWEICMNKKDAWPKDPVPWRNHLKKILRKNILRPELAFFHCYILKLGFLDGAAGFDFAKSRWQYYRMIRSGQKTTSIE